MGIFNEIKFKSLLKITNFLVINHKPEIQSLLFPKKKKKVDLRINNLKIRNFNKAKITSICHFSLYCCAFCLSKKEVTFLGICGKCHYQIWMYQIQNKKILYPVSTIFFFYDEYNFTLTKTSHIDKIYNGKLYIINNILFDNEKIFIKAKPVFKEAIVPFLRKCFPLNIKNYFHIVILRTIEKNPLEKIRKKKLEISKFTFYFDNLNNICFNY